MKTQAIQNLILAHHSFPIAARYEFFFTRKRFLLFISLMQSVNGTQFLNTTFLPALFGLPAIWAATVIVLLKRIYVSV